jgi:hypothetical protein
MFSEMVYENSLTNKERPIKNKERKKQAFSLFHFIQLTKGDESRQYFLKEGLADSVSIRTYGVR